ncbi:MAG TPA: ParB/RepB/Spo0J family partition protein, partial [Campylobacterales bacterium]|nr:ParB/RepB/Spo0J family partition protein [Campylobacterales bacterium]
MKKGKFAGLGDIGEIGGTAPAIVGGEALEVELALLDESPHQLRIDVSNIEELAASLESVGLIQPITLEVKNDGRYTIVAGHRRVEAARHNGWQTIKAVVVSPQSEANLAIKNLVENVQRDDLSPFELALAVDRAIAATGQKASDFAKTIGKSVDWLSKVRSVLRLPSSVQDSLALELTPPERRRLGVEALSELSRLED